MGTLVVETTRWLGITRSYVVRVDDEAVGSLGRWHKRVSATTKAGSHAVTVEAFGRRSAALQVELDDGNTVTVELVFPGYGELIRGRAPGFQRPRRLSDPIGSNDSVIQLRVRS